MLIGWMVKMFIPNNIDVLVWVQQRARNGINKARICRKYRPRSPLTSVEMIALQALVDIEQKLKQSGLENEAAGGKDGL